MTNLELPPEDRERVKKAKVLQIVGSIGLGAAFIILGLVYYWSLVPREAIQLRSPITIQPQDGNKKQPFFVHLDFCSKVNARGTVEVRLIGPYSEIISSTSDIELKKQCSQLNSALLIPPGAGSGQYRIKYTLKVQPNPIRPIVQNLTSESFTVRSE